MKISWKAANQKEVDIPILAREILLYVHFHT